MPIRLAAPMASILALGLMTSQACAEPLRALYAVRGGGLQVMQVEAVFDLDTPGRYAIRANWRTTGMARLFGGALFNGSVEGRLAGGQAQPLHYIVDGTWRGDAKRMVLDYPSGQPVIRQRLPERDPEREPVPEAMTRNTIDQFTAVARLVRLLAETGRCDGKAAVYDGARRVDMQSRTLGREVVPAWSSAWHGEAMRCGFIGRQLAGFKVDDSDREREPQEGFAWMAPPRPGDMPIPVRLELPSRIFGAMTVYLMEVGPVARPFSNDSSNAGSASGRSATGAPSAASRGP
jgi:hypothetical protein